MKPNKILYSVFLSVVGCLIYLNGFAAITQQVFKVIIDNNYSYTAIPTKKCPASSDYMVYDPNPLPTVIGGDEKNYTLTVTSSTMAAQATASCESITGWDSYLVVYSLENDSNQRSCEFQYTMNGTNCLAYGKPKTNGAAIYCNATATYSDPNTCNITFSIDAKSP